MRYQKGPKVDPADVLPDGAKFENIDEFKQLLLKDKDQLARALAEKLLTYATGGAPDDGRPAGDRGDRRARSATKNYGLRTLVHEIVQSKMFQTQVSVDPAEDCTVDRMRLPMKLDRRTSSAPPASRWPCRCSKRCAAGARRGRQAAAAHGLHLHAAGAAPGRTSSRRRPGKDYALTPYLEVLKDFRDDFTVISGLSHPDVGPSHDSNFSFLTGAPHPEQRAGFRNRSRSTSSRPSTSAAETRFASLPLSCEGFGLSWTRSGAHGAGGSLAVERVRQAVPRRPARRGRRPRCAASRTARASSTRSATRPRRLQSGLGADDRDKLDEYFTSVRELEQRLAQAEAWAKKPKPKVDAKPPQDIPNPPTSSARPGCWFDLIHLALQTDSTRLVTLHCWARAACRRSRACRWAITTCRTTARTRPRSSSSRSLEIEKMKTLRDFLAKLKETKEDGVSLLDRTMVFFSSNLGDAAATPSRTCRSCSPAAASSTASTCFDPKDRTAAVQPLRDHAPAAGHRDEQVRLQHRHAHGAGDGGLKGEKMRHFGVVAVGLLLQTHQFLANGIHWYMIVQKTAQND